MIGRLVAVCALVCAGLPAQDLVINELHYDPPDNTRPEEFIELYNAGATVDVSGWYFSSGVSFEFPPGATIASGQYAVIAEDPDAFEARFGFRPEFGPWEGQLAGDGESVVLRDAAGGLIDEVDYAVRFPWPLASAGRGSSMELIDPALDNDLGSHWRASGYFTGEVVPPVWFLRSQASGWRYRKGLSTPPTTWREPGFVEDGSWLSGQTPIGYGDSDDNTVLSDMSGSYSSVYLRRTFTVDDVDALPATIRLRVYVDDGCAVWINGQEVARLYVAGGELAHDDFGQNHEAAWDDIDIANPRSLLVDGENLIAIHALNQSLTSSDFSIDAELLIPGTDAEDFGDPTPGAANSVLAANAAPAIRQVVHGPRSPLSDRDFAVTAKVTDPDGVARVTLRYQAVAPGDFIPAVLPLPHSVLLGDPEREFEPNPEFEDPASWVDVEMRDDGTGGDSIAGDDIWTGVVPGQENRTLVRYRIVVEDALGAVETVPYRDDRSLNFAAFVYDGVPSYRVERRTVQPGGVPYTYPVAVMRSLPVYHLITRASDLSWCYAYDGSLQIPKSNEGARDKFNWEGAFVYDGVVYDHIRYRLRQANDRYGGSGKRSMRFRFHKGSYFEARDLLGRRYPTPWRTLNTGKGFDNKRVGNFGITESVNSILWNLVGVPAPWMHHFHFRVVDGPDEAPAGLDGQYFGDFWGFFLATENYDTRFLEAHDLEDGNLYKLKDGVFDGNRVKRHQGREAVTTDADFQNIRNNLRPERTDDWLDAHVNYGRWNYYHAVVEGIRHYDFRPADSHLKNRAWYFEPSMETAFGRLWTLPHDSDASWGPNWNEGVDYSKNAIFGGGGKPAFKQDYRNALRDFRDLVWTEEVLYDMIDRLAERLSEFAKADRDRWRSAPSEAGSQDYGSMEAKVVDMKRFAFVGWSGSTGPTVGAGGRAAYLDQLANAEGDGGSIPDTPLIAYDGPAGFPVDGLTFANTPFEDPQGAGTFRAMQWRIGEVTDPSAPGFDPSAPPRYEFAGWTTEEITTPQIEYTFPPIARVGHTYRVRLRYQDTTSRWSHWSEPVELTVSAPTEPLPTQEWLRITELHYNPIGGSDFEFVELVNAGPEPLDLRGVAFTDGIEFDFLGSAVETLAPGEHVVVAGNLDSFRARYDTEGMLIAGEYRGRLDNGGEVVGLSVAGDLPILLFEYDDLWHLATDGAGPSLEILDPRGDTSLWGQPAAWAPSEVVHGTPGRARGGVVPTGGFRLPGDGNGDGRIDLSDAIWLVRALFVATPGSLPCDGEAPGDGGNVALLDANGDAGVDVSDAIFLLAWLFQDGPAPASGESCVRIEGCTTLCP